MTLRDGSVLHVTQFRLGDEIFMLLYFDPSSLISVEIQEQLAGVWTTCNHAGGIMGVLVQIITSWQLIFKVRQTKKFLL